MENPTHHNQENQPSPTVLDMLVAQYESTQLENSFLDSLLFHQIYTELRMVEPDICDRILVLVCALCSEYENTGYIAGLKHGARLITELQQ